MTRKSSSKLYFNVSFIAYIIALFITILILQIFKHGQPALLYIVPLCVGFPLITALICKEWATMFAYEDHPSTTENVEKKEE
jgi:minor histocompatibility antigen H13